MSQAPAQPGAPPATLLFVDDEANILSSLQRLFRPLGYRILTAPGGAEGLEILGREPVDLVISDMRMPHMDGAAFLEQAAARWPDTVRILLTGYADIGSTVAAVNKGGIYRYLSKPWEDNDIRLTVQQALERQQLQREQRRLEALTQRQNEELKDLNAGLEAKVRARTQEIRQVLDQLKLSHEELKKSYLTSVKVFAGLIELRAARLAGHARRVAEHARALAQRLDLSEGEVQDVLYAALLHDIGKIGLPDALLDQPLSALSAEERAQVIRHPLTGQAALLALEPLAGAAALIRAHHERYDGLGFPDGLALGQIPLGARVLAVANDYDALQLGTVVEGKLGPPEAQAFLAANKGTRYDPRVVDAFLGLLGESARTGNPVEEVRLTSDNLRAGMVLARDLVNGKGMLLLTRGHELNEAVIAKIRACERDDRRGYTIHVHAR